MIELVNLVINQALILGQQFKTIEMDASSFEKFTNELKKEHVALTKLGGTISGYKGYTLKVNFDHAFSNPSFLIRLS